MSDDFILKLRDTWRSQELDAAVVLQRLRRKRFTPHIATAAEMLGCAFALLLGIYFAWVAAQTQEHRLLFTLCAAVLLVTVPAFTLASALARRASFAWCDETPEMLLRVSIRRAEATLRAIQRSRWHIGIIGAFLAILWILEALGQLHALWFLNLYSAVCVFLSLAAWFWTAWRLKRVRAERDACIRLLAIIQIDDSAEGTSPA